VADYKDVCEVLRLTRRRNRLQQRPSFLQSTTISNKVA